MTYLSKLLEDLLVVLELKVKDHVKNNVVQRHYFGNVLLVSVVFHFENHVILVLVVDLLPQVVQKSSSRLLWEHSNQLENKIICILRSSEVLQIGPKEVEVKHWFVVCLEDVVKHVVLPNDVLAVDIVLHCVRKHVIFGFFCILIDVLVLPFQFTLHFLELLFPRQVVDIEYESAIFNQFLNQKVDHEDWFGCKFFVSLGVLLRNLRQMVVVSIHELFLLVVALVFRQVLFRV